MKFKVALTAVASLFATILLGAVAPAQAATPHTAVKPATSNSGSATPASVVDSTYAQADDIKIATGNPVDEDTGYASALDPAFGPARTEYTGWSDNGQVWVHVKPATNTSTVTFKVDDGSDHVVTTSSTASSAFYGGYFNFQVDLNHEQTTILVTVHDGTKTNTVYKITEHYRVAPTPRIVSISPNTGSIIGGEKVKLVVAGLPGETRFENSQRDTVPNYNGWGGCWVDNMYFTGPTGQQIYAYRNETGTDPKTGYRTITITAPYASLGDIQTGPADVQINTYCSTSRYNSTVYNSTISRNIYNYTDVATPDLSVIPSTLTGGSYFTLKGTGWTYNANYDAYLYNPETDQYQSLDNWYYTGNDSLTLYVDREPWVLETGTKLQLQIAPCYYDPEYDETSCDYQNLLVNKPVTWENPVPKNVSISPAFDSVKGGKEVKIKGQFLEVDGEWPYVEVNGNSFDVTDRVWSVYNDYNTFKEYTQGIDSFKMIAPASDTSGKFDVKVWNYDYTPEDKPTIARTKFIYGATPVISSVTPASVSKLGGSQITLVGKNFGITGTPIVTIGGEKSPYVLRLSDTKVVAVVPASATTGAAEVQILSSTGGGAADAAGSITYTASATAPTVSKIAPATAVLAGGTEATITGTGFGTGNSNGVLVGGKNAKVTASTATSITFEVPEGDDYAAVAVRVATPTGVKSVSNGLTYVYPAGISSVTPKVVNSYATGNDAKVTIAGSAFGATGTVVVGSMAPQAYSTTGSVRVNSAGTSITGVSVDTANIGAGPLTVVVTPTGSTKPFSAGITIAGPSISYVGPTDVDARVNDYTPAGTVYANGNIDSGNSGEPVHTEPGDSVKVLGKGFGATKGSIKFNTSPVTTVSGTAITSWTDTEIVFTSPNVGADKEGLYDITVAPVAGKAVASETQRLFLKHALAVPEFTRVDGLDMTVSGTPLTANGNAHNAYDSTNPDSPKFRITGKNFTSGGALHFYIQGWYDPANNGPDTFDGSSGYWEITPTALTDTTLEFALPEALRAMPDDQWISFYFQNDDGLNRYDSGLWYYGTGNYPSSASYGLYDFAGNGTGVCGGPTNAIASAAVTAGYALKSYNLYVNNWDGSTVADSFGSAAWNVTMRNATGTANQKTMLIDNSTKNSTNLDVSLAGLNGWTGYEAFSSKIIKVTGTGNTAGHEFTVDCKLTPATIVTKIDGSTSTKTVGVDQIAADSGHTLFNLSYVAPTTRGFLPAYPFAPVAADASSDLYQKYEYVSAVARDRNSYYYDNSTTAWTAGVPTHKGVYYVRVRLAGGYDTAVYNTPVTTPVKVVVTAPTLHVNVAENITGDMVYKGALTDSGTTPGSTTTDISWSTVETTPTGASAITKVNYAYRDAACTASNTWRSGLPKGVTYGFANCGSNATDVVDYQVKVAGVEMKSSGTDNVIDWNIITGDPVTIKIVKRPVTVTLASSVKYYDGNDTAKINASDVLPISGNANSGVVPGEVVSLKGGTTGTYSQSDAGVDLPITFDPLQINNPNYDLQNAPTSLTGVIKKSTGVLAGSVSPVVMLCPGNACSGVTAQITTLDTDLYSGRDVSGESVESIGAITYTSKTPGKCSVDAATGEITAVNPGACQIAITQPGGTNFLASRSALDPASNSELINIMIIGDKKTPSVIVDDIKLSTAELADFSLNDPTVQFSNLLEGDAINGVTFSIWQGSTEIPEGDIANLAPGTYTIKAADGVLSPDASGAEAYTTDIKYVTGKFIVTLVPPTIGSITPPQGPEAGGTPVTITGDNFDGVTKVLIGDVTLREPKFVKTLTDGNDTITFVTPEGYGIADVTLVAGNAEGTDAFTYIAPENPVTKVLATSPKKGFTDGGALVTITGRHMEQVTSIDFCGTTLYPGDFKVNEDGSSIELFAPEHAATASCTVTFNTAGADPTAKFAYYDINAPADLNLKLDLKLDVGEVLKGADADLVGGGLQPSTQYTLEMHSKVVLVYTGTTNASGNFTQKVKMPAKSCVDGGRHKLILTGLSPEGKKVTSIQYLALTDNCIVLAKSDKPLKSISAVGIGNFLFDYNSAVLTKKAKKSLIAIGATLVGSKTITLTGYTQTNLKSAAAKKANKLLAKKRTIAVRNYLKNKLGIKAKYILIAKGATNPVSKKKQRLNRRVEINAKFLNKNLLKG